MRDAAFQNQKMIVEIEKPRASCSPSISYNEKKLKAGNATLVGYANIDDPSEKTIRETFEQYEKAKYPVRQVSFHASINPGEKDLTTEEQVIGFVRGMMERIGLGAQPYLLYRHDDIDRTHYHVVSVRVDREHHKINCFQEKRRVGEYMQEVAHRYGFTLAGKGTGEVASLCREKDGRQKIRPFDSSQKDGEQIRSIFLEALGYDFSTAHQLACILEHYGVKMKENGGGTFFQGMDRKGKEMTKPLSAESISLQSDSLIREAMERNRERHGVKRRERERVTGLCRAAFDYSRSETHFRNLLANKGISVHASRMDGSGEVNGLTLVDHTTRTAFKSSELRSGVSPQMMNEAVRTGKWSTGERKSGRRSGRTEAIRRSVRLEATALRDLRALSALLLSQSPSSGPDVSRSAERASHMNHTGRQREEDEDMTLDFGTPNRKRLI